VYIYGSYYKIKTGVQLLDHPVYVFPHFGRKSRIFKPQLYLPLRVIPSTFRYNIRRADCRTSIGATKLLKLFYGRLWNSAGAGVGLHIRLTDELNCMQRQPLLIMDRLIAMKLRSKNDSSLSYSFKK